MRTRHTYFPQHLLRGLSACAILSAFAAGAPVHAQAANTASAEAEAIILRPLSFFKTDDLDFGDIIPSNTAGTVRINPDGSRTRTGGVTLAGNSGAPARFAGLGSYNRQVLISLSSNTIFITGPGTRMRVRDFEIGSTPTAILSTSPTLFRITTTLGNFHFPVGGTLEVGANQAPGEYSGTFNITLNYL